MLRQGGAVHCLDVHQTQPEVVATGDESGNILIWDMRELHQPLCHYKQHQSDGKPLSDLSTDGSVE